MDPSQEFQVLLVEDNNADVALVIAGFRDALIHCRVHVIQNGEEALAFLTREAPYGDAPRPDLVLLDLNLPRMDGFQILEQMKADSSLKSIPVVVMTGSERDVDKKRAYQLQAGAYLVKPASKDQYFEAIRSLKELWLHTLAPPPRENGATI